MQRSCFHNFLLFLSLAALARTGSGCTVGDLTVHGKNCLAERPCPGGLVCVIRPSSPSGDLLGHCYTAADAPSCPAPRFCGEGNLWVEACEPDGHSSRIDSTCSTEKPCNPDTADCAYPCSETQPCSGSDLCDLGTGLCRPYPACSAGTCPGTCSTHVCIEYPSINAKLPDGSTPSLGCFTSTVTAPPQTPATCSLEGRVDFFPLIATSKTTGLKVTLRAAGLTLPLEFQVVNDPSDKTPSGCADAGCGHYQFDGVPTNTAIELEISQPDGYTGDPVVTTIHAGFALRADQCNAGKALPRAISALNRTVYDSYTSAVSSPWDGRRALLIGRITDCMASPNPLENATVSLAIPPPPPGRTYYFAEDQSIIRPDLDRTGTSLNGFYAAAGIPATQNEVGFAARLTSPLLLGVVDFSAKPGSAVVVNLPPPSDRLP